MLSFHVINISFANVTLLSSFGWFVYLNLLTTTIGQNNEIFWRSWDHIKTRLFRKAVSKGLLTNHFLASSKISSKSDLILSINGTWKKKKKNPMNGTVLDVPAGMWLHQLIFYSSWCKNSCVFLRVICIPYICMCVWVICIYIYVWRCVSI